MGACRVASPSFPGLYGAGAFAGGVYLQEWVGWQVDASEQQSPVDGKASRDMHGSGK